MTGEYIAATRTSYDAVAAAYADQLSDELRRKPLDRALLSAFAEQVRAVTPAQAPAAGPGHTQAVGPGRPRVWDVGCGPGHVTAFLAGLGLDAAGIDLSPGMIDEARRRHPGLAFTVGSMTALDDVIAEPVDGLVAWYCVIHVPPSEHRELYAGFRRVLKPGGHLLLAFQHGDSRRQITEAYGHSGLRLDAYRLPPERVEADLAEAGFAHVARLTRAPIGPEKVPQAYVIARA